MHQNESAPSLGTIFSPGTDAPPELLGRYHLHEYVKFLGLPLLGLIAANVFVKVVNQPIFTAWVVLAVFFGVLLWRVRQADFSDKEATTSLVIGGLLAGLSHAIMRVVATPDFHLFFNLIAEPMLAAGLGGAVGWVSVQLRSNRHTNAFDTAWRSLRKGVH
jgi:hypothetical protein